METPDEGKTVGWRTNKWHSWDLSRMGPNPLARYSGSVTSSDHRLIPSVYAVETFRRSECSKCSITVRGYELVNKGGRVRFALSITTFDRGCLRNAGS